MTGKQWMAVACFLPFLVFAATDWAMLYLRWRQEQQRRRNPDMPLRHYSMSTPVCLILFFLGWLWARGIAPLPAWVPLLVLLDVGLWWWLLEAIFQAVRKKRGR